MIQTLVTEQDSASSVAAGARVRVLQVSATRPGDMVVEFADRGGSPPLALESLGAHMEQIGNHSLGGKS